MTIVQEIFETQPQTERVMQASYGTDGAEPNKEPVQAEPDKVEIGRNTKGGGAVVGLLLSLFLWWAWIHFGTQVEMSSIENQVATDAVKEYWIAERQGDHVQICVQAGFVAAAYLQAKDEEKYNEWKATEHVNCGN